jgi:FMN reductase
VQVSKIDRAGSGFRPLIVGLGGTTRPGSTTEKALRLSLAAAAAEGADTVAISGEGLMLPMYAPDRRDRSLAAQHLVDLLRQCDGVIVASPGYHGSISGLLKNALDYTEDLRDEPRAYLDERAIGCIACAQGWQTAGQALTTLRSIAHALRGWPTPFGAMLNTSAPLFGDDGSCLESGNLRSLQLVGQQVVQFARMITVFRDGSAIGRPPARLD